MRGLTPIVVAVFALACAAAAAPATKPVPGHKQALEAVRRAAAGGQLTPTQTGAARAEIARAVRLIRGLPASRAHPVGVALRQLGAFAGRLSAPRAAALIGQLKANDDYFAVHYAPAPKTDITDDDGLVYRWFPGRCLEFHPLAEFGALNAAIARGDVDTTRSLADALVARAVHPKGGGVVWEYYFDYSGGRAPWTSGMAQAVAAQALARAASLVTDESASYLGQARAAYQSIPGHLLTKVAAGPWIRLYSFQSTAVLNAQLQTVLSLASYADDTEDSDAAALAAQLQRSALAMLPRFDTGYWTYYALPRDVSDLEYQTYVVQLLTKLGPSDPRFADAAKRFAAYAKQPPAFKLDPAGVGQVRFWLSKPATVTATSGAGPAKRLSLGDGWHTLSWSEPKRPGIYAVHVSARDYAGNSSAFDALPIVRATATGTPAVRRSTSDLPGAPPPFVAGAALDDPSQAALAQQAGLRLVRFGVAWPAGATAADPGLIAALQSVPPGVTELVELNPGTLPADDAARAALAAYAQSLVQGTSVSRLVLVPTATAATADAYSFAFAAIRDAVHAAAPGVAVGLALDGAQNPKGVLAALSRTLAGSPPDFIAFRPAAAPAAGAWTAANLSQLNTAAFQNFVSVPPVLLDGVTATSPSAYAAAISSVTCTSTVSGVVFDRLVDNPNVPGATTGLFDATGAAKPGVAAVTTAATAAQRGLAICPGLAVPAQPTTLTMPDVLDASSPPSIQLACARDCLYLVTLDNGNGRPVVAARGSLVGGAAATTVTLPQTQLAPGPYRFDVRLVGVANPGAIVRTLGSPLQVS